MGGGADQARFTIDAATGALSFIAPRDFEVATDANADKHPPTFCNGVWRIDIGKPNPQGLGFVYRYVFFIKLLGFIAND